MVTSCHKSYYIFDKYNLTSCTQHGFLSSRSTTTDFLETLNDFTLNLDSRSDTFVAYVDYVKAFNSVSVPKLLFKF